MGPNTPGVLAMRGPNLPSIHGRWLEHNSMMVEPEEMGIYPLRDCTLLRVEST